MNTPEPPLCLPMEILDLTSLTRPWVFKCLSCHCSELQHFSLSSIILSYPCPLCGKVMELHPEASRIYQRKEAEAN